MLFNDGWAPDTGIFSQAEFEVYWAKLRTLEPL